MFSPCSYCYVDRTFPSTLQNVSSGSCYAMIAEIKATPSEKEKEKRKLVVEIPEYSAYADFIEHFNTLDVRITRLSKHFKDEM